MEEKDEGDGAGAVAPAVGPRPGVAGAAHASASPPPAAAARSCGAARTLRCAAAAITQHRHFDLAMLVLIFANCACLAASSGRPGFDDSTLGRALAGADTAFLAAFTLEAALKITAFGMIMAPNAYLRDGEPSQELRGM